MYSVLNRFFAHDGQVNSYMAKWESAVLYFCLETKVIAFLNCVYIQI